MDRGNSKKEFIMENLKEYKGSGGKYIISDRGKIYRVRESGLKEVPLFVTSLGYVIGNLYGVGSKKRSSFYLQSEMMRHFGEMKDRKIYSIVHINGDKLDNRIENLKWMRSSEVKGSKGQKIEVYNPLTGMTDIYDTLTQAASATGLNNTSIRDIIDGTKKLKRSKSKHLIFKRYNG